MTDLEVERLASAIRKAPQRATFSCAKGMTELQRAGLSSEEIGRATGYTTNWVNNLIRLLRALHPEILRDWENHHPAATTDFLLSVAPRLTGVQLRRWREPKEFFAPNYRGRRSG